jgi:sodium--glutamate symport carrier gltS
MCDALIAVYNKWKLSEYSIIKIYDDVLWASPMRTTSERTKRFAVEAEKKDIESNFRDAEKSLSNKSKIIFILVTSLISTICLISLELLLGAIAIISEEKETAITLVTIVVTLFTAILVIGLTGPIIIRRIQ